MLPKTPRVDLVTGVFLGIFAGLGVRMIGSPSIPAAFGLIAVGAVLLTSAFLERRQDMTAEEVITAVKEGSTRASVLGAKSEELERRLVVVENRTRPVGGR